MNKKQALKAFKHFVYNLQKKDVPAQIKNDIVFNFKAYFEGIVLPIMNGDFEYLARTEEVVKPVVNIKIEKFQLTKIDIHQFKGVIVMRVELCRPGLIIGRAGSLIKGLTGYISKHIDHPFKIEIAESKLWQIYRDKN